MALNARLTTNLLSALLSGRPVFGGVQARGAFLRKRNKVYSSDFGNKFLRACDNKCEVTERGRFICSSRAQRCGIEATFEVVFRFLFDMI